MKETQPLLILGTRTFSEEVFDVISEIPGFEVTAFVENLDRDRCGCPLQGLPVLWIDEITSMAGTHRAVCALSTTHRERFVNEAAALGVRFATVVHPTAHISARTTLGEGCIINRGAIVAGFTELGRHVIVNRGALIGHHTRVGDYCTIQPGANVAGACTLGAAVYVGMGATVIDQLAIGTQAVVGAGAVVTADVPERVLVVGVPARVVKEGIDGK